MENDNYSIAGMATSSRPTFAGRFASEGSASLHPRLLMGRPLRGQFNGQLIIDNGELTMENYSFSGASGMTTSSRPFSSLSSSSAGSASLHPRLLMGRPLRGLFN